MNTKFHLECFSNVLMLGEPLGKMLCEGLVIFENHLGNFYGSNFWRFENSLEIFETI